jgi:hypothetical protein
MTDQRTQTDPEPRDLDAAEAEHATLDEFEAAHATINDVESKRFADCDFTYDDAGSH